MKTRNKYISPHSALLDISPGSVLMASGGGMAFSSNLGLDLSLQALDPREAW